MLPVWYDLSVGPELSLLSQRSGLAVEEVIRRHSEREYQVFALGFAPGFAFMGLVEEVLAAPRLNTPRKKVAAGSVGIAERQTAAYPVVSPGGWNLIGRTPAKLFDRHRDGYSLMQPGDTVRFEAVGHAEFINLGGDDTPLEAPGMSRLTIEASTPLCLLQDAGRFGVRHLGVTQGGAADWRSMSWANWLLGNGLDAPVIEITLGGFTVVAEDDCVLALAGADLGAQVDGEALAPWRSFRLHKGQRLQFTQPLLGARAYLAAPGGFDAPKVLGSSATVVREELGGLDGMGRPLGKGDELGYSGNSVMLLRRVAGGPATGSEP